MIPVLSPPHPHPRAKFSTLYMASAGHILKKKFSFIFIFLIYLAHWVLVVACRIFDLRCSMQTLSFGM